MPSSVTVPYHLESASAGDDGVYAVFTALWEAQEGESRVQEPSKLLETELYAIYPVSLGNLPRGGQSGRNGFK